MKMHRSLVIGILVAVIWLVGLAAYPLLESTEGRYASISWGMAHGESLVEPTFNGTQIFSKPPLAYWAGAFFLSVLPDAEWAVRLPATLVLAVCFLLTRRLGILTGLSPLRAFWAATFAVLSPLAFIQGHMTTGDIFLWAGVLLSLCCLFDDTARPNVRSALLGLGLTIGFMAKGHMVFFWVVLPAVAWYPFSNAAFRRLGRLGHPLTILTFLGLTAPWFVLVLHRHPDLAGYWLGGEISKRFLTTAHGRGGPWWYFLPQVPLLMLPWFGEWWWGVRKVRNGSSLSRIWFAWILVPLLIFSLSGSKRANYLLPMVTPMALITAAGVPEVAGSGLRRRTAGWLVVILAAPFIAKLTDVAPPTRELVRTAARMGRPLATYKEEPSGLEFYNRGRVPVAVISDQAHVQQLSRDGYLFLVRPEYISHLTRDLKEETTVVAERNGMAILSTPWKKVQPH